MPTENRSSNTEMVSVPREHELKIRQTPLADLLSGLKTGEVRDCSGREFAVGDTVLLREIDDARDYTGTVLRRTITHVQKHYGLPDHLCVLSYGQPAPQPHPEPIAWMVGTAFWWTKEEAERDAAATGLPIVGLGPMIDSSLVERLDSCLEHEMQAVDSWKAEAEELRYRLAKRDALLADISKRHWSGVDFDLPADLVDRLRALSANAEPSTPVDIDERAAFEAASEPEGANLDRNSDGDYLNPYVQSSWEGWSMRAALARSNTIYCGNPSHLYTAI